MTEARVAVGDDIQKQQSLNGEEDRVHGQVKKHRKREKPVCFKVATLANISLF